MAWCRVRTLKGSQTLSSLANLWTFPAFGLILDVWPFFFFLPQSAAHHKMLFQDPTEDPFSNSGHVYLVL